MARPRSLIARAAFQLSQDDGRGLLIYGSQDWTEIRIESMVTVHLGSGGLAAGVKGLRRYYALLLRKPDRVVLVKVWHGTERVLAEQTFAWQWDVPVRLVLAVRGNTIYGEADEHVLLEAKDAGQSGVNGAVGFAVETGALSANEILISPADGASVCI